MNKRGGEKWLSIWWFFVLAIILGAIVIAISTFIAGDVNSKKIDSMILTNKVINCLIDEGKLSSELISGTEDIFLSCQINKAVINKSGSYSLVTDIYKFEDCTSASGVIECKNALASYNYGVADFKKQCAIKSAMIEAKYYPDCYEKYVYSVNEQGEKLILHIFAGSNQIIRRAV